MLPNTIRCLSLRQYNNDADPDLQASQRSESANLKEDLRILRQQTIPSRIIVQNWTYRQSGAAFLQPM